MNNNLDNIISNGPKHNQDINSESPSCIIVGAVISRNMKIKGFKNSENLKENIARIKNNQEIF